MHELPSHIGVELFRAEVGSSLHGVRLEETGDRDEFGVCLEYPTYWAGLERFDTYAWRTAKDGEKSGPEDTDLQIHSLRKYMQLALKGNPTIIQTLYIPPDKMIKDHHGHWLNYAAISSLAPKIVSRRAGSAFLGYLIAQKQRMTGLRGQKNVNRPELVEKYGYDTKYAFQALRLGWQGIELLRTGLIKLPMAGFQREYLLAVRTGKVTEQQCIDEIELSEKILEELISISPLQKDPDFGFVNRFVIDAYLEYFSTVGKKASTTLDKDYF